MRFSREYNRGDVRDSQWDLHPSILNHISTWHDFRPSDLIPFLTWTLIYEQELEIIGYDERPDLMHFSEPYLHHHPLDFDKMGAPNDMLFIPREKDIKHARHCIAYTAWWFPYVGIPY